MRLKAPGRPALPFLFAFGGTWLGVALGRRGQPLIAIALAGAIGIASAMTRGRKAATLVVAVILVGGAAGWGSIVRDQEVGQAAVPTGMVTIKVVAATDTAPGRFGGSWFLGRPQAIEIGGGFVGWRGPPVLVSSDDWVEVEWAQEATVRGRMTVTPGTAAGSTYTGRLRATSIETGARTQNPAASAGNLLRRRILDQLPGDDPATALLAGFLVGTGLPPTDLDALRRAGISHFVAVSGSNVAGFLLLWWLVLGPLGVGPRRRGLLGLVGLMVFAVTTRWEPSVVRACLMAGVVFAGRLAGLAVDAWTALGLGGTVALLVSPGLGDDLGFQLSVLASIGIMAGSRVVAGTRSGWWRQPLGVTLSAQVAVTPLLLWTFGSVPLVSPLTNLVSAPLVAVATLAGGVGTISGIVPLIDLGTMTAGVVLAIAHQAAWLPQVGLGGTLVAVVVLIGFKSDRARPLLAMAVAVMLAWSTLVGTAIARPSVVFLDVGQGDAALVLADDGRSILIDAGPDPVLLLEALHRYRIRQLDLVIITHPHEDHDAGLVGLVGRIGIERVWYGGDWHDGPSWDRIMPEFEARGIPVEVPRIGLIEDLGNVRIEVLGPIRRYDGANDQSIVVLVSSGSITVLFTGDIELAAQRDLEPVPVDILKVPHHGGDTSNPAWLQATRPRLAVISVGENDFGHPFPDVISALEEVGAVVVRTDRNGDAIVPLTGEGLAGLSVAAAGRSQ